MKDYIEKYQPDLLSKVPKLVLVLLYSNIFELFLDIFTHRTLFYDYFKSNMMVEHDGEQD